MRIESSRFPTQDFAPADPGTTLPFDSVEDAVWQEWESSPPLQAHGLAETEGGIAVDDGGVSFGVSRGKFEGKATVRVSSSDDAQAVKTKVDALRREIETKVVSAVAKGGARGLEIELEGTLADVAVGKDKDPSVKFGVVEVKVKGTIDADDYLVEVEGTVKVELPRDELYRLVKLQRASAKIEAHTRAIDHYRGEIADLRAEKERLLRATSDDPLDALDRKMKLAELDHRIAEAHRKMAEHGRARKSATRAFRQAARNVKDKLAKTLVAKAAAKLLVKIMPIIGAADAALDVVEAIKMIRDGKYDVGGTDGGGERDSVGGAGGSEDADTGVAKPSARAQLLIDALRGKKIQLDAADVAALEDAVAGLTDAEAEEIARELRRGGDLTTSDEAMGRILELARARGNAQPDDTGAAFTSEELRRDHLHVVRGEVVVDVETARKAAADRGVELIAANAETRTRPDGLRIAKVTLEIEEGEATRVEEHVYLVETEAEGTRLVPLTDTLADRLAGVLVEREDGVALARAPETVRLSDGTSLDVYEVRQLSSTNDRVRVEVLVRRVEPGTTVVVGADGRAVNVTSDRAERVVIELPAGKEKE